MSRSKKHLPMGTIGHFTRNAVENFEENMVSQTNYLEKTGSIKSQGNKTK